jgi:hypothetical protein
MQAFGKLIGDVALHNDDSTSSLDRIDAQSPIWKHTKQRLSRLKISFHSVAPFTNTRLRNKAAHAQYAHVIVPGGFPYLPWVVNVAAKIWNATAVGVYLTISAYGVAIGPGMHKEIATLASFSPHTNIFYTNVVIYIQTYKV